MISINTPLFGYYYQYHKTSNAEQYVDHRWPYRNGVFGYITEQHLYVCVLYVCVSVPLAMNLSSCSRPWSVSAVVSVSRSGSSQPVWSTLQISIISWAARDNGRNAGPNPVGRETGAERGLWFVPGG